MKIKLLFIFILIFNITISQNSFFVDSIQKKIEGLQKKEKLKQLLEIPYDKFMGNISSSKSLAQKAIKIAIELNDSISLAEANILLAQIYNYQDKREKKIIYNLNAIRIYEEIGKLEEAGYAYGELGFSIKREDLKSALFYMRKGLKIINKINNLKTPDATLDNYGILQRMIKNYDSAIYYHNKSLQLKKLNNDSIGIPYSYVHLATVNINLKNYKKAKQYIDSAHVIRVKRSDIYGITDNYVYYGDLYFSKENYTLALENYKKGFDLSIKNNFLSLQKYCANYLTKSYLKQEDYKNAFTYNSIFQSLKDSTINTQTNTTVAELQIEFETEKKEKEIAQQKEQLLKNKLEIKSKNLISIMLSSLLLLLVVISFGLYKRQQHKKREFKNKLLLKEAQIYNKLQNQRLRISRDLHDNIGSQLTFIISSIDNLKFITKKSNKNLKTKLSEINEFTNSTISQLRDTIWAMNKNEINFEDLQSRVLTFIEKAKIVAPTIHFKFSSTVKSSVVFSSMKGMNIFRVLQESINNSLKYAKATEISIAFSETKNELLFNSTDNGNGFDINTVKLGNGLENMQKRIQEINGVLSINSEINKGTNIQIKCLKNKSNDV
ncbi:MAG: histidine kinase [Lutibacter sp.]|uniref:tetratricopeptide repeat-containing sensor histidine kinase n=1 Tax=Lutibacter sp. TaxID=1925666 RepID=UPI00385B87BC